MDISSALYIFLEDKKRVDKYGPKDGHPLIVGLNIFRFLKERLNNKEMDHFREIVKATHFIPYDETKPDARTDKSSDILGLLWRKGPMELYNSEEFADVCDFVYQIDLDRNLFRIMEFGELLLTFDEIQAMSEDDFVDEVNRVF